MPGTTSIGTSVAKSGITMANGRPSASRRLAGVPLLVFGSESGGYKIC